MAQVPLLTKTFLILCGLAFLSIALQALYDPQLIMDLVKDKLTNTSSRNSIRAMYGGVNLALGSYLIYSSVREVKPALVLLALYTGGFFFGRITGFIVDGMDVSPFIISWTITELLLCAISITLLVKRSHRNVAEHP